MYACLHQHLHHVVLMLGMWEDTWRARERVKAHAQKERERRLCQEEFLHILTQLK